MNIVEGNLSHCSRRIIMCKRSKEIVLKSQRERRMAARKKLKNYFISGQINASVKDVYFSNLCIGGK